jgi:transposase InsO family protein
VKTPFVRRYDAVQPGELMTADFKGQFRMGNGRYCYPLTLVDSVSRYLLACEGLTSTRFADAWPVIERVFREHGLPAAMQSDNGPPFGPIHGRYSRMSIELMKLDIQPVFSRPARPSDNGRHERMHRDLKERTTRPASWSLRQQQWQFDAFRQMYNEERPHEGINMMRPSRLYRRAKPRPFPRRRASPQYPPNFEVRRVAKTGLFKWKNRDIFLSHAFAGEQIGLQQTDHDIWTIHFHRFAIGKLDENQHDCF